MVKAKKQKQKLVIHEGTEAIDLVGSDGKIIATLSSMNDSEQGIVGVALDFKPKGVEVKVNGEDIDFTGVCHCVTVCYNEG